MALIYDERIREKYGSDIVLQLEDLKFDPVYAKYRYHFIIWHRGTGVYKSIWFDDPDNIHRLLDNRPDVIDSVIDRVLELAEKKKADRTKNE